MVWTRRVRGAARRMFSSSISAEELLMSLC
ncbi:unnamed protein product [Linum tenue]|uniref:Uncharacterized protein n=1 Tax=Linum tenue TaxID=586396 RepID=A0AAV0J4C5_9ROSI|nr:unnamed protein product [Linum tenue]CAI0404462.1 unnamed protein product [Linum tenue]